jgi:hypothetical protein
LNSTGLPVASIFRARFFMASISACCDDGMPRGGEFAAVGTVAPKADTRQTLLRQLAWLNHSNALRAP